MPQPLRSTPYLLQVGGETIATTFLGAGAFTRAYRAGDTVYCLVEGDPAKSLLCDLDLKHVPRIRSIPGEEGADTRGIETLTMPYYPPLRACHGEAWAEARALARTHRAVTQEFAGRKGGYWNNAAKFEALVERAPVSDSLRTALEALRQRAADYSATIGFEAPVRNLGVDAEGALVLRDVLFDAEVLAARHGPRAVHPLSRAGRVVAPRGLGR